MAAPAVQMTTRKLSPRNASVGRATNAARKSWKTPRSRLAWLTIVVARVCPLLAARSWSVVPGNESLSALQPTAARTEYWKPTRIGEPVMVWLMQALLFRKPTCVPSRGALLSGN